MTKKIQNIISIIVFVLFAFVLITTQMMTNILARYQTGKSSSDIANVASFDVDVSVKNGSQEIVEFISYQMKPGETISFDITLDGTHDVALNKTGNEVKTKYTINIQTLNNLPLEIKYNDAIVTADGIQGTLNPLDKISLEDITISWNNENNSYLYSGQVDLISVVIKIEQVD